jgi:hypothetical protein
MATVGTTIMMTGVMDGVMAADGVTRSMVGGLMAVVDGVMRGMVAAGTHSRTKATEAGAAVDPTL